MPDAVVYADLKSVKDFPGIQGAGVSDSVLNVLIEVAKNLITAYTGKTFGEPIPAIVKLVTMQLVAAFLQDPSYKSESIADYSYTINDSRFKLILGLLDAIPGDDGLNGAARRHLVQASVI